VALVAELQGEAAGVEVGAALAVLMDDAAVGELGPAELIDGGQAAEGEEMHHRGKEVVGVGRTAGDRHHRLAEHVADAGGAGRVRLGGGHAAPGGAGADGDDGGGIGRALLHHVDGLVAADLAVDAVVLDRDGALDHQDILALVGLHGGLARGFGLVAGGGHQGLVVIERNDVEDEFLQGRMLGAQQRFGAAGAFLEVQPDHRRPLGLFDGLGDGRLRAGGQAQRRRGRRAELQELAPVDAEPVGHRAGGFRCFLDVSLAHVLHPLISHFPNSGRNRRPSRLNSTATGPLLPEALLRGWITSFVPTARSGLISMNTGSYKT